MTDVQAFADGAALAATLTIQGKESPKKVWFVREEGRYKLNMVAPDLKQDVPATLAPSGIVDSTQTLDSWNQYVGVDWETVAHNVWCDGGYWSLDSRSCASRTHAFTCSDQCGFFSGTNIQLTSPSWGTVYDSEYCDYNWSGADFRVSYCDASYIIECWTNCY